MIPAVIVTLIAGPSVTVAGAVGKFPVVTTVEFAQEGGGGFGGLGGGGLGGGVGSCKSGGGGGGGVGSCKSGGGGGGGVHST